MRSRIKHRAAYGRFISEGVTRKLIATIRLIFLTYVLLTCVSIFEGCSRSGP